MNYTIDQIVDIIGGVTSSVTKGVTISKILTDSRSLTLPQETLFFALVTKKGNGHNYLFDLYEKGVRTFVVSDRREVEKVGVKMPDATFLFVENTLKALQELATYHRNQFPDLSVIGITGSNGKTIVKEWLHQLLSPEYTLTRSPKSFNSQIGVPLSVWNIEETTQMGIFEAGISTIGEMQNLEPIIRPSIGIFTHLGVAHQEGFSSMEEKCREKLRLFEHSKCLIYNSDDTILRKELEKGTYPFEKLDVSFENRGAFLFVEETRPLGEETEIHYQHKGERSSLTIPFTDKASVENAVHCLALLLYLGYSKEQIQKRMRKVEGIAMRMEVNAGVNNCVIINDSYTADLQSLEVALDFLNRRASSGKRKKTLILSDIQHAKTPILNFYQHIAELLSAYHIDRFIGIGEELSSVRSLFPKESMFYPTTELFLKEPLQQLFLNEVVLVKGSRSYHLEDISEYLEQKVHETILEVNLDAIVHNFHAYKQRLRPETKMVCMVKAFGYGSGSVEIAKTLQEYGCNYLAVATADEGVELRKAGVYIPILVMNPEFGSLHTLFNYHLEPEVYSFKLLESMRKTAIMHGIDSYPIHLKINTGMNRLGFVEGEMEQLISVFPREELSISSIFSHLYAADNPKHDDLTREQFEIYERCSNKIRSTLAPHALRHILNTAGIVRFTEHQMEMVRLGIGLYGVPACGEKGLRCISTLKSNILQIQRVKSQKAVGYGGGNCVQRDSLIAIVPIGYADGLNRHLGRGNGYMVVKGKTCPSVGNVCMDATMIDVTDVPQVREGDEVIIFGENPSVSEIAEQLGTIPYEVLTSVSSRVKRIYVKE